MVQAMAATHTKMRSKANPRLRAVPAVTRAAAILRLLAHSDRPLRLQAIAKELVLVPSTCLHILRALAVEELVALDEDTKTWRLGAGLLSLSRRLLRGNGFATVVQDVLEQLAQKYSVTAIGLEVHGLDHVVVVAISRGHQPFHIHVEVGSRFPALISASGRCIAAFGEHDDDEIEARFRLVRWDQPPSYARWRREVKEARRARFSTDINCYIRGVTVIAAPILRGSQVRNLLVVVGLTERLQGEVDSIGKELLEHAAFVAERLEV
jgi:DNA-binding IclR family transcriptional regulator